MSKCFKENGFLSEDGKKVLQPLHDGLMEVKSSVEVREMTVQELQVLRANLAKLVGDLISDEIYIRNHQPFNNEAESKIETQDQCTGCWWHDEYGNEAFVHNEYISCPIHDDPKIYVKV